MDDFLKNINKGAFSNPPYVKKINKPWGYELHLVPENSDFMMKIIHINAGHRLSLQAHSDKWEAWVLKSGDARLILENRDGVLEEVTMQPGVGYTSKLGQKHRLKAGSSDAEIFEASTPEKGTTYRLEDDYSRPDETEEMRKDPDRGWKD